MVFRSPAVHTPQAGKELTTAYLSAAVVVLGPTLAYQRQWYAERNAVLEFEAELDGLTVHGIDMMQWNDEGRLVEFTVMVRPFKGLEKLIELMAAELFRGRLTGWATGSRQGRVTSTCRRSGRPATGPWSATRSPTRSRARRRRSPGRRRHRRSGRRP